MSQDIDNLPLAVQEKIRRAILEGAKLDAVKIYRAETGANLLVCKNIVEEEMNRLKGSTAGTVEQGLHLNQTGEIDQILELIFANKKLDAVRAYRDSTGTSLLEAKKFIEELIIQLNEECPEQFEGGNGFQSGCASVLIILFSVACCAITFCYS